MAELDASPLPPAAPPLAGRLLGRTLRFAYGLAGRHRYDDFRLEWLGGTPLLVIPSVFNPKLLRTGAFLAEQLDHGWVGAATRVLDMGTGSGVCAVRAARYARSVVAVDINPAAVRCATLNALLNGVESRLEVRHGDLFAPVAAERFDLILFNPPFMRGAPRDDRERAWRCPGVAERFAADLPAHLTAGGCALVLLSSFGDAAAFLQAFARHGLSISAVRERRFVNEHLVIYRVRTRGVGA
jgi:release factor glutamine methyltransferase